MRPTEFEDVIGQSQVCLSLEKKINNGRMPQTVLFAGPSGVGKTTLARICRDKLECTGLNYHEYDCADARGIDDVRGIKKLAETSTLGGRSRVFVLDEIHQMTKDGQSAFLKTLEDTPKNVYFFLCTTDPDKLIPTIRTRATSFTLRKLASTELHRLLFSVAKKDRIKLDKTVAASIIESADGSARSALVSLDLIRDIDEVSEQLAAISATREKSAGIDIARAILSKSANWQTVASLIKACDEEPEKVRRVILGYASTIVLNSGNKRAFAILDEFSKNYFDSGKAGLVASAYSIFNR